MRISAHLEVAIWVAVYATLSLVLDLVQGESLHLNVNLSH